MSESISDRPNKFPLPPILLGTFILAGFILGGLVPGFTSPGFGLFFRILGGIVIALAIGLDLWVFKIFSGASTTIRPDRGAAALVTGGPFRFSRNPIYVGNIGILAGLGLFTGIWLFFAFSVINFFLLDHYQIRKEEAHLAARFGMDWHDYADRVRRWL